MDDNIGFVLKKLEDMGQLDNTHRRLHHRQRRRGHHVPGRRRHAVQGREADHLGRRHARSVRRSLAGSHQAGHDLEGDVRVPGLAADVSRHRRWSQGRRPEEADRTGGLYQASSRPRSMASTSATTLKARRSTRRATSSSTTPARNRRRCGTRTGSSTTRWCPTRPRAGSSGAQDLSLDPDRQHHARPLRDRRRQR